MRIILFILSLSLWYSRINSQPAADKIHEAIIWRGFHHQWRYNHRVNCLGDYVLRFDTAYGNNPTATHISATGTGPDHTYYDTYYTLLKTHSAVFLETHRQFILTGDYDSLKQDITTVDVPFIDMTGTGYMDGKTHYIVLLNGFEMHEKSLGAKKIKYFKIEISKEHYNSASHTYTVGFDAHVKYDCFSLECCGAKKQFKYYIDAYFLIIGYNDGDASAETHTVDVNEKWTYCKELKDRTMNEVVQVNPDPRFTFATVGIRSIEIALPGRAMHLLEWNSCLSPPLINSYGPGNRQVHMQANLLFKQWRKNMVWSHPFSSFFCFRQGGSAIVSVGYALLQFKDVDSFSYEHHHQEPVMFWPGNGIPSFTTDTAHKDVFVKEAEQIYNIGTHKMEQLK